MLGHVTITDHLGPELKSSFGTLCIKDLINILRHGHILPTSGQTSEQKLTQVNCTRKFVGQVLGGTFELLWAYYRRDRHLRPLFAH